MNSIIRTASSASHFRRVLHHVRANHSHPLVIYNNPQRLRAAGMTFVAATQAAFWASATTLAHQFPDPLLTPAWSVAGFGLSAAFIAMVRAYLRRNVAEMSLVDGPSLSITAHSFCGFLRTPVVVPADDVIPSPKKDDVSERYWTIGIRQPSGRKFYYIVDTTNGVLDQTALSAAARGGDHLLVFSHKRDGGLMRHRWQEWERTRPPTRRKTASARTEKVV